ncbi:hypothetical protein J6590_082782 [Homalodisca vitripennis]|nr:hypothetical protein J6590_082782 [Homalodisca vitripennis]
MKDSEWSLDPFRLLRKTQRKRRETCEEETWEYDGRCRLWVALCALCLNKCN